MNTPGRDIRVDQQCGFFLIPPNTRCINYVQGRVNRFLLWPARLLMSGCTSVDPSPGAPAARAGMRAEAESASRRPKPGAGAPLRHKLLVTASRLAFADYCAFEDIRRRETSRSPVPLIVMR